MLELKSYFNIYIYFMFYYILFKNVLLESIRYIKLGFILLLRYIILNIFI